MKNIFMQQGATGQHLPLLTERILAIYARPGVAAACIRLQDEASVDVIVLLFAIELAAQGWPLSNAGIATADAALRDWREKIVLPLRNARRSCSSFIKVDASALKKEISNIEINAELLSLGLLIEAFSHMAEISSGKHDDLIRRVITYYSGEQWTEQLEMALEVLENSWP